jgi:colicin import membrane protein
MIINMVESAWVKPKNIQDGLVCDLRLVVNRNGRIISVSLIKSSGNIRFDNSAMKAVNRVESFNFYNKIPNNLYADNFKKIVITFNPS